MRTPEARSSLVVSQDVDIVVPVEKHDAVRQRLASVNELEPPDQRYTMRSNLSLLSLLEARAEMPDPVPHRARLAELMARLEKVEAA